MLTLLLCGVIAQAEPASAENKIRIDDSFLLVANKPHVWTHKFEPDKIELTLHAISYDDFDDEQQQQWYTPEGQPLKGRIDLPFVSNGYISYLQILMSVSPKPDDIPTFEIEFRENVQWQILKAWADPDGLFDAKTGRRYFLMSCGFDAPVSYLDIVWEAKPIPWDLVYSGPLTDEAKLSAKSEKKHIVAIKPIFRVRKFSEPDSGRHLSVLLTHQEPEKEFLVQLLDDERNKFPASFCGARTQEGGFCFEDHLVYDVSDNYNRLEVYRRKTASFRFRDIPGTKHTLLNGNTSNLNP